MFKAALDIAAKADAKQGAPCPSLPACSDPAVTPQCPIV